MTDDASNTAPGCRDTAFTTLLLLGFAVVFLTVGLTMARQEACTGFCETLALTLLYAGGPISAAFGVVFGELVLAWPLDITFWVAVGFLVTRWTTIRDRQPRVVALVVVLLALVYGLVLSQFVEIAV